MDEQTYPALRLLLEQRSSSLYPDELTELRSLLGRVARLEVVNDAATALLEHAELHKAVGT